MARRRRKQSGVLATLLVELSALVGIFGIAQPTVRNNLWQMVQPATIHSRASQPVPPEFDPIVAQPEYYAPNSNPLPFNVPEPDRVTYPSAYTAQAAIPQGARTQSVWKAAGYNPMGSYQ